MLPNGFSRTLWVPVVLTAVASAIGCSAPAPGLTSPLGSGIDPNKTMSQLTPDESMQLCRTAVQRHFDLVPPEELCLILGADRAMMGLYLQYDEDLVATCQSSVDNCNPNMAELADTSLAGCTYATGYSCPSKVGAAEACTMDAFMSEAHRSSLLPSCADLPAFIAAHESLTAAMIAYDGYPASCKNTCELLP